MKDTELIVPVYLNQRLVFDLLAMLQDGISTVTRVSSAEHSKGTDQKSYGAAFGLSQALSGLLKIDVSGSRMRGSEAGATVERADERIHTPASLFYKLRSLLVEHSLLKFPNAEFSPSPGDIIEVNITLSRNPLIQALDALLGLLISVQHSVSNVGSQLERKRVCRILKPFDLKWRD